MFNKIASTFFIKIIVAFINLAIAVVLSRLIGAEGKGEASLILTSIAMLSLFTDMIGGSLLVFFVPRHNILFLFIISNAWSFIICFLAYFILIYFQFIPTNFILPVVILSFINSILATNMAILLGKEKIINYNTILLFQAIINIAILCLFIHNFHEKNVYAYIYSLYLAFGVCFVASFLMIIHYLKDFKFTNAYAIMQELFKIGILNQLGHILKFMSFRFIYYIIAEYSGEAALGVFSNGSSVTEAVLLITNSYATVIYPRISNSTDIEYSRQLIIKYTKHTVLLSGLAIGILILFPNSFWLWLFGNEFTGLRNIILLLCPGIFFYNIGLIVGYYFSGIGRPQVNTVGNFIGLITTFILVFFILPHFDLIDISIISTVSYLTTTLTIVFYFLYQTKTGIKNLVPSIADLKDLKNDIFLFIKK